MQAPEIGIDQLAGAVRGGAAVIDVREPHEYVAGHVPGAVLIPMGPLPGRIAELDRRHERVCPLRPPGRRRPRLRA